MIRDIIDKKLDIDSLIGQNNNLIMGGFWGGYKDTLLSCMILSKNIYLNEFIAKERIDNDQTILGYFVKDHLNKCILEPNAKKYVYMNFQKVMSHTPI